MSLYTMIPGNQSQSMRNLIVDNVEKYRLEINNKLVYAKAKINFDLNLPLDGQNKPIYNNVPFNMPASCYVFYGDGFYRKKNDNYYKYPHDKLDLDFLIHGKDVTPPSDHEDDVNRYWNDDICKFTGWYLVKDKDKQESNQKIETIDHLKRKTDLFDQKNNDILPNITLYAGWEIATCTVYIRNIKRHYYNPKNKKTYIGFSSFKVDGVTKTGKSEGEKAYKKYEKVPYNTLLSTLVNGISEIKYTTWGNHFLDGTAQQKSLRKNPQKFVGWSTKDVVDDEYWWLHLYNDDYKYAITQPRIKQHKTVYFYPQFTPITIFKHSTLPKGTYYTETGSDYHYMQNIGGHYYLLFTGKNQNSHLHELWNLGSHPGGIDYIDEASDKGDVSYYYNEINPPEEYDEYYWELVARDSNISASKLKDDFAQTPYSCTLVYQITKREVRK